MSDNFQQHEFDQDAYEFDSWGPGRDTDEVFVSRVRWFGGHTWRGNWFAAGWFVGVGTSPIGCVQVLDCGVSELSVYDVEAVALEVFDLPKC